jgi:hypothetical protein
VPYAVGDAPLGIATGDFNGDGEIDLATADLLSNSVSVLLGNGIGGFGVAASYSTGGRPVYVTTGDSMRCTQLL